MDKMGELLSYRVVYQFIWIFGLISACPNSVCYNPAELTIDSVQLSSNGDCYSVTDSLISDPLLGRSHEYCPEGFENYKGYCLKVDLERKSWEEALEDSANGELAVFYRKEDADISAEYLRIKFPGLDPDTMYVWTSGIVENGTSRMVWGPRRLWIEWGADMKFDFFPPSQIDRCLTLKPSNYTRTWISCDPVMQYSLRIAYFVTGNSFMCYCNPGYVGATCESKASGNSTRFEMKNPPGMECPQSTSISIEFALYKYSALPTDTSSMPECAAPNTLALLRYLCQGKEFCRIDPSFLKSFLSYPCDELNSTLTIQYTCLSNNEMSCNNGMIEIQDDRSRNCAFVTHKNESWNETMKLCQTHGGQLAAFKNNSDDIAKFSSNTRPPTSFWTFGEFYDKTRSEYNNPTECMKAITDSQDKPIIVQVTRDCSRNLTGICVSPPFRQISNPQKSIPLDTTPESTTGPMQDPILEVMLEETTTTIRNCSAQFYGGLTWPATIHGVTVEQPCPAGQNGYATWTCQHNGQFNPLGPDFSFCTTAVSDDIASLSNDLAKGTHPDVVVTELAVTLQTAETMASGDLVNAIDLLDEALVVQQNIMTNMTNEEKEQTMNTFTFGVVNTTGVVLDVKQLNVWFGLDVIERASKATKLLVDVESTGILYASVLTTARRIPLKYNETLQLIIETRDNEDHSELQLPNIIIPSEAFKIANKPASCGIIPVVATTYSTIGQVMPIGDHFLNMTNVTQVIGASLNNTIEMDHDKVIVTIAKPLGASLLNQSICVYWIESCLRWSTDGCELGDETNDTHFVCKCNHMTNFAVLMSLNPEKVDTIALNVISIVGCFISIICLVACIITFALVRKMRVFSNQVHLHLCISLMTADIILIMAHFYKTNPGEDDVYCTALAMLLHYFYLATFMWMCLEGVQAYLKVVKDVDTRLQQLYPYLLIGYGIPGVVVGISAGVKIEGYGTENHCFLDTESGLIWGFVAFVLATLIFNAVLLFLALRHAHQIMFTGPIKRAELPETTKFWIRRILILHPLLGLTWLFGFLQFGDQLVFSYIFTILSSLQGMFVLMFTVFLNERIRQNVIEKANCGAKDAKSPYSSRSQSSSSMGPYEESEEENDELNRSSLLKKDIPMDTLQTERTEAHKRKLIMLDDATGVSRNSSYC